MTKLELLLLVTQVLAWVGIAACAIAVYPWARRAHFHWRRNERSHGGHKPA